MFSALRLPKYFAADRIFAWLVPALVTLAILSEPASSLAERRARRTARSPVAATRAASASQSTAPKPSSAGSSRPAKLGAYNPKDETVEMFEAIDAGQIAVKVIPKDSTQARIFVRNKTKKPLNVRLPEAFAAVPVLAQMGGMGGGGMAGGGGQGMGGGGGGGGMFNVPAEREGNVKVACVCLEHGKAEPRPQMVYAIKPIQSFTTKPGVAEVLKELGNNRIAQRAAQVAAWHLNNDMSWATLADKRIELADGRSFPYFSQEELLAGRIIVEQAVAASQREKQEESSNSSPGETAAK